MNRARPFLQVDAWGIAAVCLFSTGHWIGASVCVVVFVLAHL